MTKILTLGISVLAIAAHSASANIKFDLRAAGSAASPDGKLVSIDTSGAAIQLEIWAQVTNAAPTNSIFGVQSILGAIVSSNAAGITGTLAPLVFPSVFNATSVPGTVAEFSSPVDTLTDLGSSSTSSAAAYAKARKDPTSAGETITGGTFFYVTNNQPLTATVHQITNGYEFLMGTTTLSITNIAQPIGAATLNWKIPGFTTAALRGQIAAWTDGDNVNNTGSGQFAEMSVGAPISLIVVPEPSAFGMVLMGALGIVGFRRVGMRKF